MVKKSLESINIDKAFLFKLSKSVDELKHRIDHLEHDVAPEAPMISGLFCNVVFTPTLLKELGPAYSQQIQNELAAMMKKYYVHSAEIFYKQ